MRKENVILSAGMVALTVSALAGSYWINTSFPSVREAIATSEQLARQANHELLYATVKNSVQLSAPPSVPHLRKDSWGWYWNQEAQLRPGDLDELFGNTFVDHKLQQLANDSLIPLWDKVMQYDLARALTLVLATGFVLSLEFACFYVLMEIGTRRRESYDA